MTPPRERVDRAGPSGLDGAAAELYRRYSSGTRVGPNAGFSLVDDEGRLLGPPAAWMLSPELGLGLEQVGAELRFNLALPDRWREIVILLVAALEDSEFERFAHHRAARHAGLGDAEITALDTGSFAPEDPNESVLVATTRALLDAGDLDDAQWAAAESALGRRGIFEVVALVGWYRLMALQLRVFRLEPPAGARS